MYTVCIIFKLNTQLQRKVLEERRCIGDEPKIKKIDIKMF